MAYILNSVDFSTYGILPGQISGGNIALRGCFDMPERIGDVYHEWGDENGLEVYAASAEIFYGGRDIAFEGLIEGTRETIYSGLQSLYTNINAASGLQVFSTPYGNFNVYPKQASPTHHRGISIIKMDFREPVPDLSGGTIPETGSDLYTIDAVPMRSFGLYASSYTGVISLPEMKQMQFTKAEEEGYQITKRRANKIELSGVLLADDLTTFMANIKNLYALFTAEGERQIILRNQATIAGYILNGFKVDKIRVQDFVIGEFKCEITATSIT